MEGVMIRTLVDSMWEITTSTMLKSALPVKDLDPI